MKKFHEWCGACEMMHGAINFYVRKTRKKERNTKTKNKRTECEKAFPSLPFG